MPAFTDRTTWRRIRKIEFRSKFIIEYNSPTEVRDEILNIAIALAPLQITPYAFNEIIEHVLDDDKKKLFHHFNRIRLIENVYHFYQDKIKKPGTCRAILWYSL